MPTTPHRPILACLWAILATQPASAQDTGKGGALPTEEVAVPVSVSWRPDVGGPDIRYGDWFRFRPDGYITFRYTLNYRWEDLSDIDTFEDPERPVSQTWNIPRFRFRLTFDLTDYAEVFIRFGIIAGGNLVSSQAYTTFHFGNFHFRAGRYWEGIVAAEAPWANELQFVDYSLVGQQFGTGSSHGLRFSWEKPGVSVFVHLTDGMRTGFHTFLDPIAADIAGAVRVEGALAGARTTDLIYRKSSFRGSPFRLVGGIGAHYQTGGRTGITRDFDVALGAADLAVGGSGWSLSANGTWQGLNLKEEVLEDFFWSAGLLVQGGVFVHDQVELAARYDALFSDDSPLRNELGAIGTNDIHSVALGLNYFIIPCSYALRVQADFTYIINPLGQDAATTWAGLGLRTTETDGQFISRLQLVAGF